MQLHRDRHFLQYMDKYRARKGGAVPVFHISAVPRQYHRLKINGEVFQPNDTVCIKEYNGDSYATLMHFSGSPDDATVRIRWFYQPRSIFVEHAWPLGHDELFDSDHEDEITAMAINSRIKVLTLEEYLQLDKVTEDVFYMRAKYLASVGEVVPALDQWRKVCVCRALLSPRDVYRMCGQCKQYFHPNCVGEDAIKWKCPGCR